MRKSVLVLVALGLTAGVVFAEVVEKREVVVKLNAVGDEAGLSTFDLSDLAIGETREIVADSGATIIAQRDEAGILLDLGNGKTLRLPEAGHGVEIEGEGGGSVRIEKHLVRSAEGDHEGAAKVMIFRSADGEITELDGDESMVWSGAAGTPKVMIFHSEDGEVTELTGPDGDSMTWEGEDGQVRVIKKIVRHGGSTVDGSDEQIELLISTLGADGEIDAEQLEGLLEGLENHHPCAEGEDCGHRVVIVKKRVERTGEEE